MAPKTSWALSYTERNHVDATLCVTAVLTSAGQLTALRSIFTESLLSTSDVVVSVSCQPRDVQFYLRPRDGCCRSPAPRQVHCRSRGHLPRLLPARQLACPSARLPSVTVCARCCSYYCCCAARTAADVTVHFH